MIRPANFRIVSDDPDCYTLAFSVTHRPGNPDLLHVISEAIHLRLHDLLEKYALNVLGASHKADLFEPFEGDSGYVEIDILQDSDNCIALEVYLYDRNSVLKGKASCSLFLEAGSIPPRGGSPII